MKRACFVLHDDLFTPWPVMRAVKEIEVLRECGYEISVVSWIKGKYPLPETENKDGINLYRIDLKPPERSFFKRLLTYMKISKAVRKKLIVLKPDIIISHDLEMLYAAVKAKKALKVPLFYDAHENWPEMVAQNSKFESRVFGIMEKRLLKNVTHSYTYGDDLKEKFNQLGFPATTLYNSKSLSAAPKIDEQGKEKLKMQLGFGKDDFILGFAGASSLENGLKQTLDSLNKLPDNIKFFIVGGSGKAGLLEKAQDYTKKIGMWDRVKFTGRVSSDTLLRNTAVFDIGTALFQPLSANEIARIPNKIFDYMALSIPMVVSDFPNMRKIVVEESDCGLAVNPMDIEGIANAVLYFYENPSNIKEKGESGRRMFEGKFCWDMQKKKLINSHEVWRKKV
jgi:glycosyltransferase involved in cell wall biosynthesis